MFVPASSLVLQIEGLVHDSSRIIFNCFRIYLPSLTGREKDFSLVFGRIGCSRSNVGAYFAFFDERKFLGNFVYVVGMNSSYLFNSRIVVNNL